jgi:hypothetical protein
MFWDRKIRVPADALAKALIQECVETPIPKTRELFPPTSDATGYPTIAQQLRLYQFASVLLAVLDAERSNPAFTPVREALERHYFPPTFAQGARQLDELRSAMADLVTLIQPEGEPRPMSWALNWLKRIGVDESNPATLGMFALRWPSHYTAVAKSLKQSKPI